MVSAAAKKARKKAQDNAKPEASTLTTREVLGMVDKQVFDYLPVFLQALKEMNDNLKAIRKALED